MDLKFLKGGSEIIDREEVLKKVKKWVREVGELQLEKLNDNLKVRTKSNKNDLVTEVDELSEEILMDYINQEYPDHSILSEESGVKERDSKYKWIIDPLDGTTNYAHGFSLFAISVALKHKGDTIVGVVYLPSLKKLYYALKGEGAFVGQKRLEVSTTKHLDESLLITDLSYYRDKDPDENINYFNKIIKEVRGVRKTGSAALDLCCIAEGSLDCFWELELKPWDIAAGSLIIEEAGGRVITFSKEAKLTIIAANKILSTTLMEKIKK
ncbi:inositol monophosphatase family protein [Orenia marismortui]|uniref:inositol monophosphatase family protein n=1 Tax=Orenia marismortui TaxID=46469 RepID=UPI002ADDFEDB|nr:inositol monophosphatase family protein [Orenia marismortui]